MFYNVFLLVHVLVAISLVALVLLQQGRGADAGAAFGSGASATVFGAQGSASFLSRVTAMLATGFFVTSLILGYFATQTIVPSSVLERMDQEEAVIVVDDTDQATLPGDDVPAAPAEDMETETGIPDTAPVEEVEVEEVSTATTETEGGADDIPALPSDTDMAESANSEAPPADVPVAPDAITEEE